MLEDIDNVHFSVLIEHNPKVCALFSPKGHAVANAVQSQLQIWNVESKETSHKFECNSVIDFIKWSPDSELICCGMLKDSIQVWNLEMLHWRCKLDGCLAFLNIYWAPDSRHLLVVSEFYIKVTIFSLVSAVVAEIDSPKAIENGIVFSPCEKYLVIALRLNCEDHLGVYSCDTWEVIKVFPVETKDMVSITFSSTDLLIAILDTKLEYKVMFYSIDGRMLGKYSADASFGLISLNWSSAKNLVALGDCLGQVNILNCFNYKLLTSYEHSDVIESTDITVYKVKEKCPEVKSAHTIIFTPQLECDMVIKSRPVSLLPSSPDGEKGKIKNPLKGGVQTLQFSTDGKYIASVNGNMPKAVFVYDVENLKLRDVLIRGSSIKSISWHPEKPYLIISSSSNVLDVWTPESCIRHISPYLGDFLPINVMWSPKNDCILLNSRDFFSVMYFS